MDDLNKLLEGGIDDVKASIASRSHDDLLKLKDAETGGKNRKGVIDALDAALNALDAKRAGGFVSGAGIGAIAVAAALDTSGPANIAPAETFSTSGAAVQIVPDVDASHPAVDNDPRAGTTVDQNRIDFNDPNIPGHETVERALKAQA